MFQLRQTAAVLSCAAAALVAFPAAARPAEPHVALPAVSVCVRNLAGADCGRYQRQLLQATALRAGDRTDAAMQREIGRRQLDQLIDAVS